MTFEQQLQKEIENGSGEGVRAICSEIFDYYRKLVFSVAYQILENQDDAEDATEEAFVSFFSKLGPGFSFNSIKYYLLNSVRFISYKVKKQGEKFTGEFEEETIGVSDDVMALLDKEKGLLYLKKALDKEELSIVLEHILEEKTFKEIGEERGISENSISGKYKRAIDKVRKERKKR